MESNRRIRRPHLVSRAVRKLRGRSATIADGTTGAAPIAAAEEVPVYPQHPHLSLVTDATPAGEHAAGAAEPSPGGPQKPGSRIKPALLLVLLALAAGTTWLAVEEARTSTLQAKLVTSLLGKVSYHMAPGPSDSIRFPSDSPYDERLGYSNIPDYLAKLKAHDYVVAAQARISPKMAELADRGLFATYHEKTRVGLDVLDAHGQALFSARYPERTYAAFNEAPPLLVNSLLFIENRELLDPAHPKRNPAIEWDRFSKAVFDKTLHTVGLGGGGRVAGGSTLATQIEKYRHSAEGRTSSLGDKLRQMASATLRAYQGGEDTTAARHQIVLEYLNTVPLSAKVGYGEVNGIGDGMRVWYGRDFAQLNALLAGRVTTPEAAMAYKEALSLMIAQRRPAYYLGAGARDLETLTNSHLRVLAQAGVITPQLRDLALAAPLRPALGSAVVPAPANTFVSRKAANAVRNHLASLLGDSRLYNLDRLDLSVVSTLDASAQKAVTAALRNLNNQEAAAAAGLTGKGMLGNGDPSKVVYSFTLMERGPDVNYLRVQTDNFDQPLDINEGAKLDLGSTAKLRTLVTYLDIMDQLHKRFGTMDKAQLDQVHIDPKDHLSQWAVDYFRALPASADRGLPAMLDASLERKYSGSPYEGFFTGGGLHIFHNFSKLDDHRILTIREGLRSSTNLLFIRLMRDVVRYYMFQLPGSSAALLADADDPRRAEYLSRFADREGKDFLAKFWNKYKGKTPAEAESQLMASVRLKPSKLAAAWLTIHPDATLAQFGSFLNGALPSKNEVEPEKVAKMYEQYSPANMTLADRGYVASIHPLELWLVGYLRTHPKATWDDYVGASVKQRQDVYSWLFKTHHKHAQDKRIGGLIEVEAFLKIHAQWKKMGYPFDSLVPSYATTLGASADRPGALAELMGILVNAGERKPTERIESMHFAKDTPYETLVKRAKGTTNEQVISPEVARATLDAIRGVVSDGTAKRAKNAFVKADGTVIPVGGKTGTGDQRFDVYAPGGRLIESRYVNRSATFVFNIGERFFGTMTAYVHGPDSANYDFTSALPVQLLVTLAPTLMPMIEPGGVPAKARAALAPGGAAAAPEDGVRVDQEQAMPEGQDDDSPAAEEGAAEEGTHAVKAAAPQDGKAGAHGDKAGATGHTAADHAGTAPAHGGAPAAKHDGAAAPQPGSAPAARHDGAAGKPDAAKHDGAPSRKPDTAPAPAADATAAKGGGSAAARHAGAAPARHAAKPSVKRDSAPETVREAGPAARKRPERPVPDLF